MKRNENDEFLSRVNFILESEREKSAKLQKIINNLTQSLQKAKEDLEKINEQPVPEPFTYSTIMKWTQRGMTPLDKAVGRNSREDSPPPLIPIAGYNGQQRRNDEWSEEERQGRGRGPREEQTSQRARSQTPVADVPECSQCGKRGHLKRDCWHVKCYRCGGTGHMARDCPTASGDSQSESPRQRTPSEDDEADEIPQCSNCGKRGHWTRDCWHLQSNQCDNCGALGHHSSNCRKRRRY
eukprot:TRINITY_DN23521_c0_g1_i1.p1 TRINITY_DN23521_c0_g1~~TRINITY_DN23521_c0_g1_i1.p1  ORF type:complete len:239 (-),score=15.24 TRINITY_DN23521_c0_g1_i1:55-771(-)